MTDEIGVTPLLGLVENMAWVTCPKCGERIEPFGRAKAEELAQKLGVSVIGSLPLDERLTALADQGKIEEYRAAFLGSVSEIVEGRARPS